jgi:ADP-ribosylglycohydrolase
VLGYKDVKDRILGCLQGVATGDAIGKQTETLTPEAISHWYPQGIRGFHGQPGEVMARYVGRRYPWRIGETTDDTEQTLAVAQAMQPDGRVTHERVGTQLLTCRKSNRLTLSLGRFQEKNDPRAVAADGDGCGAAMRAAPIGVVYSYEDLPVLTEAARQASIPTHGGTLALAGACAVAAAVSAALEQQPAEVVVAQAAAAARLAESNGQHPAPVSLAAALDNLFLRLRDHSGDLLTWLRERQVYPDDTSVIVPLAISLAAVTKSAESTILIAVNLGGDTDSVAAIGGGVAGALAPDTVNQGWVEVVEAVNQHHLEDVAEQLSRLRA